MADGHTLTCVGIYLPLSAMTVNMADGHTLTCVGIYLPSCFVPMDSSVWNFPQPLHLTMSLLQLLKGTDNL